MPPRIILPKVSITGRGSKRGASSGNSVFSIFPVNVWVPFSSTCLSAGRYLPRSRIMYLQFRNSGRIYKYRRVEIGVWIGLLQASSRGRFYNWRIKGRYI